MSLDKVKAGEEAALVELAAKVAGDSSGVNLWEAKDAVMEALTACKSGGKQKAEAWAQYALFSIRKAQGESQPATTKCALDSAKLFREAGDSKQAAKVLLEAAKASQSSKLDESLRCSREVATLCKESGDRATLASALLLQVQPLLAKGNSKEAMTLAREAATAFKELNNKQGESSASSLVALAHFAAGDVKDAKAAAEAAIQMAKACGDQGSLAMSLHVQGEALLAMDQLAEARTVASEGLALLQQASDAVELKVRAGLLHTAAKAQLSENPAAAMDSASQASSLFLLLQDPRGEAAAAHTAAKASLEAGSHDMALQLALQALEVAAELADRRLEAQAVLTAARARFKAGRFGEALIAARKAAEVFRSLKDHASERAAVDFMGKIQEKLPPPHRPTKTLHLANPLRPTGGMVPPNLLNAAKHCVVWTQPCTDYPYIHWVFELLRLIDDLGKSPTSVPILVCSKSAFGRPLGQEVPGHVTNINSMAIYGVCRTARLEQPRMHINAVDLQNDMDANEIARVLCDASVGCGPKMEAEYAKVMDASKLLQKLK